MLEAASLLSDGLHTFWQILTSDPIRSVTAFAATGGLIVGWKNLNKDSIRVDVVVKRAQNGPLVLQHPTEEFLLFEIYNQGMCPVVVNEVGIKVSGRLFNQARFINLVDLPDSYLDIRGKEEAIGTLECVGVPGTIPHQIIRCISTKVLWHEECLFGVQEAEDLSYQPKSRWKSKSNQNLSRISVSRG